MTTPGSPLKDLAERIAHQEADLAALRRDYEVRQEQLNTLTRREQELEAELRQVESDISTIAQGPKPRPTPPAPKGTGVKSSPPRTPQQPAPASNLPDFIVALVREANGRPITVRQVTEEATHRGLTTASRNPTELVRWHAKELVKKRMLRRAPKRAGLLLGKQPSPSAASPPVAREGKPAARTAPTAPPSSPARASKEQRSLREVVIQLLRQSKRPLVARELAAQALAGGYQTDSTNFVNLVQVTLGKMSEVERAHERGYRLKKTTK